MKLTSVRVVLQAGLMIMSVAHGNLCLVSGLLTLERRENFDRFIAAVKLTHMALEAETLIRRTRLLFTVHFLHFQQVYRTDFHTGPTTHAFFFIDLDFNLYNVFFGYFGHCYSS
jgi:hypothetical protein